MAIVRRRVSQPTDPVLAVTRQGLELRNPKSPWPFTAAFALSALTVAAAGVIASKPFDGASTAPLLLLMVAAAISGRVGFRTSSNHLQAAPMLLYVVAAAALVGTDGAIVVGAVASAASMFSPLPALVFSTSLGAAQGSVVAGVLAVVGQGDHGLQLTRTCLLVALAGGATWAAGQGIMYVARAIPLERLWRVEIPSTTAEVAVATAMAPALIAVAHTAGTLTVAFLAAAVIGAFVAFRTYRERLLALQRRIEELSRTDALTGIANRRAFVERLDQELARFQRTGAPFALLLLDLDRFKEVNDRYGHTAGDETLVALSNTLLRRLRETDLLARIGGDEFAVVASGVTAVDVVTLADDLSRAARRVQM
jgi:GGDEF domain-containing protein